MELTIGGQDWSLVAAHRSATAADLARAAEVEPGGLGVAPDLPLAELGLLAGSRLAADSEAWTVRPAVLWASVVAGLDAGRQVPLHAGRADIGRAAGAALTAVDPTVSRRHAALHVADDASVAVEDLGSRNGTWLTRTDDGEDPVLAGAPRALPPGATLRIGASEIAIEPADRADAPHALAAPSPAGTIAHNRPPRSAPPSPPSPVAVPDPPEPPGKPLPLGVVGVLAPLAMAALLVALLGNPVYAVLALLSPVIAIGNHLEGGRRNRRSTRRDAARRAAELARTAERLAGAADTEVARRRWATPDLAEVLRRAEQPSTLLWERRPAHEDFLRLRVGVGAVPWDPPLTNDRSPRPDDLAAVVAAASVLGRCPATIDLAGGGVVGVVGPRPAALAVARALLCQAAVHHGPADLPVAVVADEPAAADWAWSKWLPHVQDPAAGGRRLAAGRGDADALATALASGPHGPAPILVVDGIDLLEGRRAPVRALLAGHASGIVVAATGDQLPAACTAVVMVEPDSQAELRHPGLGRRLPGLRADGVAADTAERCARALARFDDPELDVAGAGLPDTVRLLALLGLEAPSAAAVARRWRRAGADPRPVTPIGMAVAGVIDVDLVADGPHALVAGTTGAGKSELLRTLVAGLAAGADPEHVTFLLVDFKGGSAFDACARLPHVVGLVTDLDDDLARRALRCLDAELRHRERVLRAAGAADLAAYRNEHGREPLPRLVVVVDEFATLKAELPDFVDALVGVAQRGRSLGVHLVLATQRPSGAVSDHIRANANLRIALRVQDAADSRDVVEVADAARLPRGRPGRACVRLGPGEVVAIQTALATGAASAGATAPVALVPFEFGPGVAPAGRSPASAGGLTDLERLVDACASAWSRSGRPLPRRPWPEPLPATLDRARLPEGGVALADDPDGQRQVTIAWRPAEGNLAVYGVGGSGTTTTLVATALALADAEAPDRLHLYAVDHGAGDLAVLAGLPHTGAVIGAGDRERQQRLVRWLRAELDRRRAARLSSASNPCRPRVVVLVDGVAGFLAAFDDVAGLEVLAAFERVFADGPEVGVHVAVTADRPGALPSALASLVRQRWVHRLADALDAGAAGVSGPPPRLPPGRFVDTTCDLVAQVGVPAAGWDTAVAECAQRWGAARTAPPIGELPAEVRPSSLGAAAVVLADRPWSLPIGIADDDLAPAVLPVWEGDHVLVAGPGRSGRTTALATIAGCVLASGTTVLAVAGRRSWLASVPGLVLVEVGDLARAGPALVLVDDAEGVDDPAGVLERLATSAPPGTHLVAAGRADALRGLYGHWTRTVRRSRLGLLLRPHLDLDGELLGTPLPRRVTAAMLPGRGFLVADGTARLIQVAQPD